MKDIILDIINQSNGIKNVDLALKIMERIGPSLVSSEDIVNGIEQLVDEGEVLAVEYIIPKIDYRIKAIYFPLGTRINITHNIKRT